MENYFKGFGGSITYIPTETIEVDNLKDLKKALRRTEPLKLTTSTTKVAGFLGQARSNLPLYAHKGIVLPSLCLEQHSNPCYGVFHTLDKSIPLHSGF